MLGGKLGEWVKVGAGEKSAPICRYFFQGEEQLGGVSGLGRWGGLRLEGPGSFSGGVIVNRIQSAVFIYFPSVFPALFCFVRLGVLFCSVLQFLLSQLQFAHTFSI